MTAPADTPSARPTVLLGAPRAVQVPPASSPSVPLADLVAGAGLGLLVGFLLGLSVTQVVGGVITALAALLGGFLGLSGDSGSPNRTWRIGAFGLCCVLGIIAGLDIRANDLLAPSVKQAVKAYEGAGYPPQQARDLVAFERLGIKPSNATVVDQPPAGRAAASALYADKTTVCSELRGLPAAAQLRVLDAAGGGYASLGAAAQASSDVPHTLAAGVRSLCD